ncbi:MAG: hypothetical protein J3K34DRAFT_490656 [Monoraphidium minutum]|nr:MAG: hypothetical protein J3K34DRAFT_490656 [Monoraphidium minutum]
MKLFGWSGDATQLPPDRLRVQQLARGAACLQATSGIPLASDCCAYEPIQRLLAVSTDDGRVKVFGREGVERTLHCGDERGSSDGGGGGRAPPAATRQLLFLVNRGAIVRIDEEGELQLWAVDPEAGGGSDGGGAAPAAPLQQLALGGGDAVTHAAAMQREPFLLLGCSSGAVRVAHMVNASGAGVTTARQVRALKLTGYSIPAKKLEASGEVTWLSALSRPPVHLLLAVHSGGGAAVWDLRAQRLVAVVPPSGAAARSPSPGGRGGRGARVTAAAWLGGGPRGDFVTGHAGGDVLVWALPQGALSGVGAAQPPDAGVGAGAPGGGDAPLQPRLLSRLRVVQPAGGAARAVRAVEFLVSGKKESLLVFGGQEADMPDGLAVLELPLPTEEAGLGEDASGAEGSSDDEERAPAGRGRGAAAAPAVRRLPWFGAVCAHCLVPAQGSISGTEESAAILALLEGGELSVHALAQPGAGGGDGGGGGGSRGASPSRAVRGPKGYRARFQGQPRVTAARLRIGACMTSLRAWSEGLRAAEGAGDGSPRLSQGGAAPSLAGAGAAQWRWIVDGGRPARPEHAAGQLAYATLYCTGHEDGAVRLWDVFSEVPMLLGTVPSREAHSALGARGTARPVSTLEFAWEQGLLITGHEGGEVRVYQFDERPRAIDVVHFESVGGASNNDTTALREPPGFQLRLQSLVHSSDITTSAYNPAFKHVAVADKAGTVSLIDLAKPALLWLQAPMRVPVASLALARCPLPHHRDRNPLISGYDGLHAGAPIKCVVVAAVDSSVGVLDAATGFFLSREGRLKPKTPTPALLVEALDAYGAPVWAARDVQELLATCRDRGIDTSAAAAAEGQPGAAPGQLRGAGSAASLGSAGQASGAGLSKLSLGRAASSQLGDGVSEEEEGAGEEASAGGGRQQQQQQQQQQRREGSPLRAGARGAPGGGARGRPLGEAREARRGGGGAEGYSEEEEDEEDEGEDEAGEGLEGADEDIDQLLARAAAQVEEQDKARRGRPGAGRGRAPARSPPRRAGRSPARGGGGGGGDSEGGSGGGGEWEGGSSVAAASSRSAKGGGGSHRSSPSPTRGPAGGSSPRLAAAGAARLAAASSAPPGAGPGARGGGGGGGGGLVLDDPEAAYILVATEVYLRLYTVGHAARGDRTAARRAAVQGRLRFAAAFSAAGSPALVALVERGGEDVLQVFTLPGLELLSDAPLSACVGWHWEWDRPSAPRLPHVAACTRHGHLALLGPHRELVRLALAAGLGPLAPAESVFDWDMATAAHAAGLAAEQARAAAAAAAQERAARTGGGGGVGGGGSGGGARPGGEEPEGGGAEGEGGGGGVAPKDFRKFMAKIGQDFQKAGGQVAMGLQKAIDETHKGLQKVADLPALLAARPKDDGPAYKHPELDAVFCATAAAAAAGSPRSGAASPLAGAARGGGGGGAAAENPSRARLGAAIAASANLGVGGAAAAGPSGGGGGGGSSGIPAAEAAARRELLGGTGGGGAAAAPAGRSAAVPIGSAGGAHAASGGGGAPGSAPSPGAARMRTAAEIREAYGRPKLTMEGARAGGGAAAGVSTSAGAGASAGAARAGVGEVGAVMAENRAKLAERGEKLRALQDKGADLEESAAGFAEMARALAEREKQRAKWFGLG